VKTALLSSLLISLSLLAADAPAKNAETQRGESAYKSGDYAEAMSHFLKAAAQGDATAQFDIGTLYERGIGVDKSAVKAAQWYQLAANAGNSEAQFKLATMYQRGNGMPASIPNALKWYKAAADQGSVKAKRMLENLCDDADESDNPACEEE
jgi:uncharacterized protein